MIYIVILIVYNIFLIMILANVQVLSKDYRTKYRLEKFFQMTNSGASYINVKDNEYHSIFLEEKEQGRRMNGLIEDDSAKANSKKEEDDESK